MRLIPTLLLFVCLYSSAYSQTINDRLLIGKWHFVKEMYTGEGTEADITFYPQPSTEKTIMEFQANGQVLLHTLRKTSSYSDTSQYQLLKTILTIENTSFTSELQIEKLTRDTLQVIQLDSRPINLKVGSPNIVRYRQVFLRQPDTLVVQITDPAFSHLTKDSIIVEEMPSFPKGPKALMKFLGKAIKYPKTAEKMQAQGTVLVKFTIAPTGEVIDGEIIYSPRLDFAIEVVRLMKLMPNWTPGKQNGKPVPVKYALPIQFRF
ncbi:MAG: TonB family protein [Bacteroidota bacterium]